MFVEAYQVPGPESVGIKCTDQTQPDPWLNLLPGAGWKGWLEWGSHWTYRRTVTQGQV